MGRVGDQGIAVVLRNDQEYSASIARIGQWSRSLERSPASPGGRRDRRCNMASQVLGDALEREHRDIDEALARFAAGLPADEWRLDTLRAAAATLRRHIYIEEEFLFPALRAA